MSRPRGECVIIDWSLDLISFSSIPALQLVLGHTSFLTNIFGRARPPHQLVTVAYTQLAREASGSSTGSSSSSSGRPLPDFVFSLAARNNLSSSTSSEDPELAAERDYVSVDYDTPHRSNSIGWDNPPMYSDLSSRVGSLPSYQTPPPAYSNLQGLLSFLTDTTRGTEPGDRLCQVMVSLQNFR